MSPGATTAEHIRRVEQLIRTNIKNQAKLAVLLESLPTWKNQEYRCMQRFALKHCKRKNAKAMKRVRKRKTNSSNQRIYSPGIQIGPLQTHQCNRNR